MAAIAIVPRKSEKRSPNEPSTKVSKKSSSIEEAASITEEFKRWPRLRVKADSIFSILLDYTCTR